ncbi:MULTISPECIES: PIG-L family deacetylase [unclassified Mesorhizobium]|uniref:PIG-L deacetylase family protein n=1 Tax=unclassified Mesorhizobium TaxID=325217 RepID=UPI00112EE159|nr:MULTISPECIES: PIG-L family deacetylase [unclassified Mesorhizobium]MCA0025108.1 PIG-L family deacetylase [Mesorhizobium sp. B263B1A]TPJ49052.1 PIG-L family deacetylase [Mesorhizobium sp. B2-6-4]TPJ97926.1 PIG-L family deacetylase [Mesorhizobium sp. B2-5-12]TPK21557.1 PIG-L family deacetylase [Mesorhizobium sp. B2-5-6]TPL14759.1 PIG-L family deacetylase [Mesorhizobium sp. B2-4-10]
MHQPSATLGEFAALLTGSDAAHGSALMVVVAHPDDETIGIGGHLAGLRSCRIVHVTDGAPRDLADAQAHGFETWQDYADARRAELTEALAAAGISPSGLTALGYPDKEAAANLVALAQELACLVCEPDIRFVCTHPFEGGHPDHDATAFAVHAACHLLRRDRRPVPTIIEMAFYSAGPDGPVFQDFASGTGSDCIEVCLTEAAFQQKQRMLASHLTQQRTLAPFSTRTERFRLAPTYDFLKLPNDGRLYYESLPLGFEPGTWLHASARAHEALRLDQP